jgi:hypothetical protein
MNIRNIVINGQKVTGQKVTKLLGQKVTGQKVTKLLGQKVTGQKVTKLLGNIRMILLFFAVWGRWRCQKRIK